MELRRGSLVDMHVTVLGERVFAEAPDIFRMLSTALSNLRSSQRFASNTYNKQFTYCMLNNLQILFRFQNSLSCDIAQDKIVSCTFCDLLSETLDLNLSFYRPLCYNNRAPCPLPKCLPTTRAYC